MAIDKKLAAGEPVDMDLVWWLVKLGQTDRDLYRKVRSAAWDLVIENSKNSVKPNNGS